jgi:hypothetical protein
VRLRVRGCARRGEGYPLRGYTLTHARRSQRVVLGLTNLNANLNNLNGGTYLNGFTNLNYLNGEGTSGDAARIG